MRQSPAIHCVIQQPTALILGVVQTELPADAFTVIAQRSLHVGRWQFRFHIIGESHLIRIERGGALVQQEILACSDLEARLCQHHHAFHDLAPHAYQREDYHVMVDFARKPGWMIPPHEDSLQLEVAFPEVCGYIPCTRLYWRVEDQAVYWWTLHTYPDHRGVTYVRSMSRFVCA